MTRVLLFGGTAEGRELACRLADAGVEVLVSVASQTGVEVLPDDKPGLKTHVGAMGLDEKLKAMGLVDAVVDATHPYAQNISRDVRCAADMAGKKLLRVVRAQSDTEGCILAESLEDAIQKVPATGNVLSTTGSKQIPLYAAMPGFAERLYARVLDDASSIEACRKLGLKPSHIIARRGPFTLEDNIRTIRNHNIQTLITKDSGKAGGYPQKLAAARECGTRMIVVCRPVETDGMSASEAFDAIVQVS